MATGSADKALHDTLPTDHNMERLRPHAPSALAAPIGFVAHQADVFPGNPLFEHERTMTDELG